MVLMTAKVAERGSRPVSGMIRGVPTSPFDRQNFDDTKMATGFNENVE
ncbi:hypothetical protein [Microvirga pudoricolor]|nr:hypothetical protein [Microvirga pudoricolor]MBM6593667.1 hypothetical protein [Microvirga pudoricolor]